MVLRAKYLFVTVLFVIALGCALEPRAYAYVDPGSGLLVFQGISAVVSGALFYFRRRIKSLFSRQPVKAEVETALQDHGPARS